jgi:hypothetical protein
MQSFDRLGAQRDSSITSAEADVGVMAFCLGKLTNCSDQVRMPVNSEQDSCSNESLRWIFVADMNRDGFVTISDVWLWMKWVFYAPGAAILFGIMLHMPSVARFFEIATTMLYGGTSFIISFFVWWFLVLGIYGSIRGD